MKKLICLFASLLLCFALSTCAYIEPAVPDYQSQLIDAAASLDIEGGRHAAEERNTWLDRCRSDEARVDFDELLLLARLIHAEAGSDWLSDEYRLCVGEIALNRVASTEFPNTLEEVVYQKGQYRVTEEPEFAILRPSKACARAALRLMLGERMLAPQVVFQSDYRIGPIYARFYDSRQGYTYFCESMRTDLYGNE